MTEGINLPPRDEQESEPPNEDDSWMDAPFNSELYAANFPDLQEPLDKLDPTDYADLTEAQRSTIERNRDDYQDLAMIQPTSPESLDREPDQTGDAWMDGPFDEKLYAANFPDLTPPRRRRPRPDQPRRDSN